MIETLHIKNYALIDNLTVEFKPGLNIFTGSTGAGKTIIIGALSLALGERASEDSIRTGTEQTLIEADVKPQNGSALGSTEFENEDSLLIRREIKRSGRSKVSINDRHVTLTTLKDIGLRLADISGQHRQRGLTDQSSHLEIIDNYAGLRDDLETLAEFYRDYENRKSELSRLQNERDKVISEKELLEFQIKEIDDAGLEAGEDTALETEKTQLAHAETVKATCTSVCRILFDDEGASLERLQTAIKEFGRIVKYSDKAEAITRKLEELSIHLDETGNSIRELEQGFEFDPGRQDIVEDRLVLIKKLKRKYGGSIEEILRYSQQAQTRISQYHDLDSKIETLTGDLIESRKKLSQMAISISQKRRKVAGKLEKDIERHLAELAMKEAKFKVGFTARESDDGPFQVNQHNLQGDETGFDIVEFLICPNPGEELKPLASTASGGELSRILLAIISSIAEAFPRDTLVFDEVDTGISGEVASQVGKKLQKLAQSRQVICITHLQQIASRGEVHFKVYKGKSKGRTITKIKLLDGDDRVEEIARLLAGEKISDVAKDGAARLLEEGRS